MPGIRILVLAGAVALSMGLYFALWMRWPTFLAIAAGATMGVVLLLIASSLADDPARADAAWRAAAPDLAARERAAGRADERDPGDPDHGAEDRDGSGAVDDARQP